MHYVGIVNNCLAKQGAEWVLQRLAFGLASHDPAPMPNR